VREEQETEYSYASIKCVDVDPWKFKPIATKDEESTPLWRKDNAVRDQTFDSGLKPREFNATNAQEDQKSN